MAAPLNANIVNILNQWPNDATLTLIQNRRAFQQLFSTTAINNQQQFWRRIARAVNNAHPNYQVNKKQ
jgi:hypothetical protein